MLGYCSRFIVLGTVLFAAGSVSAAAQTGCGLDGRNLQDVALPVIDRGSMSPALAAEITRGYELVALRHKAREGQAVLEHARAQAIAASNACGEALAEYGLGQVAAALQLSDAMPHVLRAEHLWHFSGTPLTLAIVHERIAALKHLTGDNDGFLIAAPGVEKEYRDAGDPASAIRLASTALQYSEDGQKPEQQAALFHELESIETPNVVGVRGYVQWQWGSSLRRAGRYAEILGHFEAAQAAFTQCGCDEATQAAVLLTIAAAYSDSGDPETILTNARAADAIYRRLELESLRPQALRLIAAAYARQQDWPHALAEYEAGLRLADEQHAVSMVANLRLELASAYGDSGNPRKGLDSLIEAFPAKMTPMQECSLAAVRLTLEDQAGAFLPAETEGQKVFGPCKELLQPGTVAKASSRYADAELWLGHLQQGLEYARQAVAIIDTQRPRVQTSDSAQIEYNEHQTAAYTLLIRALLRSGKTEEALLASDQGRARAFVDLTATAATRPAGNTGGQTTGAPPSVTRRGGIGAALHSEAHPFTLTSDDIHRFADTQHATLISYWLGDGQLYTWVVAPGKAATVVEASVKPVQLASLVRATLPSEALGAKRGAPMLRTRGGESQAVAITNRKPWRDLYALLIAPIAAQLPTQPGALLTVIPQGPLFQLSFAALLDPANRYLVEHYAIDTAPSMGILEVTAKNEAAASAHDAKYLVVANPERLPAINGVALPPLPGTESEAKGIVQALNGRAVTLLDGKDAGISRMKALLPQSTVLHLATHAIVDDRRPAKSFLALDTREEDGKLTTAAIYGLHLQANLVVLSACSTGRGKVSGDGVSGLSRAFLYAGSASLMTTLWDVVDEPTARLMPAFYTAMVQGKSRSVALREAQMQLIADLRQHRLKVPTLAGTTVRLAENPAYWAAFSLSGQP
jgi:CHAT domain-containing protein/tetratricopeptide (TPR) repeat protein